MTRDLQQLLRTVPAENRRVLLTIINLAQLVLLHKEKNRMDEANLGTIFGPSIFWTDVSMDAKQDIIHVNLLFTFLVNHVASFIESLC